MGRTAESDSGADRAFGEDRYGWRPEWAADKGRTPSPAPRNGGVSDSLLVRVIEGEIIPRLLLAHRGPPTGPPASAVASDISVNAAYLGDIEGFARLVLTSEPGEIVDRVQFLIDGGVKLERIYLELLAPVARLLGVYWLEDRCSFAEVTLGLSHLHQAVHLLGRRYRETAGKAPIARQAFFAPSPGDQHTFGLAMIEELFQVAGWQTASDHAATRPSIMQTVAATSLDLVGFSVGCGNLVDPLVDLITQTRKASRNREIVVMVGGRFFVEHPEAIRDLGADRILLGGDDAVGIAEELVNEAARKCGTRTFM
jgi:methanogenic corrinoid protein MtbC1